jgi:hypothetical protein
MALPSHGTVTCHSFLAAPWLGITKKFSPVLPEFQLPSIATACGGLYLKT